MSRGSRPSPNRFSSIHAVKSGRARHSIVVDWRAAPIIACTSPIESRITTRIGSSKTREGTAWLKNESDVSEKYQQASDDEAADNTACWTPRMSANARACKR